MDYQVLEKAGGFLANHWKGAKPLCGFILGSGWSEVVAAFKIKDRVPYQEIPGLGAPGIEGHAGVLVLAEAGGVECMIFQGRRHWYEGVGWTPIAIPVFLLKKMQVESVFITNAAGGINSSFHPGNLMVMSDHINLMGINPLVGPHNPVWGPRYPDMTYTYDKDLRSMLKDILKANGESPHEGVYCAVSGPSFETPAEIRMMKTMGADAVGMSTVPEAILARGGGLRVAGLSCITNYAAGISKEALTHQEVIETTRHVMPKMRDVLLGCCERMAALKP